MVSQTRVSFAAGEGVHRTSRFVSFADHHPRAGPVAWMCTFLYLPAQVVTALAWQPGYDWAVNYVSYLGTTGSCPDSASWVCAPSMLFFNVSICAVGSVIALGSALLYARFRGRRGAVVGFGCLTISGVGTVVLGTVPSNTIVFVHHFATGLGFVAGTLGIVLIGFM